MRERTNRNLIETYLKGRKAAYGVLRRGDIRFNSVEATARFRDGQLIGKIFGLPVYRKASLSAGQIQYYGPDGSLIHQNF